jgi:methionyl-tRNA formyltransferase
MNITLLLNRDLGSHLALSYLCKELLGHNVSLFMSEKVGSDHFLPSALLDLALFEQTCLDDGRPRFNDLAQRLNCHVADFMDLDNNLKSPEALSRVAATEPDLILSIRFGLILPQTIIDLPKYGVINLHSGLLPVYRGVMATFRAMLNGDVFIGSTLHFITDPSIDRGAIIATMSVPLKSNLSYTYNVLSLYSESCAEIGNIVSQLALSENLLAEVSDSKGHYYSFPENEEVQKFFSLKYRFFDASETPLINKMYCY